MLSRTSEYALRAVIVVARRSADGPVLARDISKEVKIPLKYLQKVLRDMVGTGLLASSRGMGGGYTMALPPEQITLLQIVEPFDDRLRGTTCPFGNPYCGESDPCPVHEKWAPVARQVRNFFATTTLADILHKCEATATLD